MQVIKTITRLLIIFSPLAGFGQSTFLPEGSKDYILLERMEIKQQVNPELNLSSIKPYSRKRIVKALGNLDSVINGYPDASGLVPNLSRVDKYNFTRLMMNNSEWVNGDNPDFMSSTPILGTFYKTKANFLEVKNKDFFLAVNPVLQLQYSKGTNDDESIFQNTRGVTVRGLIAEKLGFSTTLTDNQERTPKFVQNYISGNRAVPGAGFYKSFKNTGVDYFDARGYITFNAAKFIDFQFGYDRNFIGNGHRSLFLSDFGTSNLFLKINTRIWKLNYQNLFMELMPQYIKTSDTLLDRKYAAMHHLSMNVTKWLNIGLFEGVIFGRRNHFDFQYLNPIIFYRHVEGTVGSPDNALAGIDFKANVAKKMQFYGQFLLDEFILSEIRSNPGSWVNKYGIQAGMKYVDALGVKNLDLQFEFNEARPFTYSHYNIVANYTHYNQPLAHPLGANFREFIGIARFQPVPKLLLNAQLVYYTQGLDSAGFNFGGNPFRNYNTRVRSNGLKIGSGMKAKCLNLNLLASYEVKENIFLDASAMIRRYKIEQTAMEDNTNLLTIGLRWNIKRRYFDF